MAGQIVLEIDVAAAGFELAGDGLDLLFGEHGRVAINDCGDLLWSQTAIGIFRTSDVAAYPSKNNCTIGMTTAKASVRGSRKS